MGRERANGGNLFGERAGFFGGDQSQGLRAQGLGVRASGLEAQGSVLLHLVENVLEQWNTLDGRRVGSK
jgi:hypothetical protein